mgnify:CR=1 FL=1
MLAAELGRSVEQVERDIEFLERTGVIRRVTMAGCMGCSDAASENCGSSCAGCTPDGGFKNMGVMWEIV